MVMWHVQRIENPPDGSATLTCLSGQYPARITLIDQDTGAQSVVDACFDSRADIAHVCGNLQLIGVTFTPNDWDAECGA